ncbi:hypothetical protein DRQ25_12230 [Candidatus Fermentibacteria bacterium]|nr:MAG: hypothetical protein DRQ25_12230 [Candidatus Fermentibacteria bacterium]
MEISMFINNSSKCFALLWAVLLFSGAAMAESSWSWQHPYPTGSRINGIQFINNSDGWIVTELGALFCTDDGGVIWEELYRGDKKLESVFFLNTSEGWACGEDGILIHTVDGGANWAFTYPSSQDLLSIEFSDENYGTIGGYGGTILRTMNGGASWQYQGSGITSPIYDVSFVNPSTGWATGTTGNILSTSTGGAFWEEQNTGISVNYTGVHFIDDSCGFAVGGDYIASTDEGGNAWSAVYQQSGADFSDVDFSGDLGAASGKDGVAVTVNGGEYWLAETLPPQPPGSASAYYLYSVSVPGASRILSAGLSGLIFSRNSSGDWSQLSSHTTLRNLNGITHFDENHVWACGNYGVIMASGDGGVNWESQVIDINFDLEDICFPTVLVGYCVGSSDVGIILKTVDGGGSWTDITPSVPAENGLYSVDFMNEDCGVAVGSAGGIVYTTDGGASWTEKTGFGSDGLTNVRFGDTDRGWIVGGSGKIICFDFNSDSWSEQTSSMSNTFHGLFALNADTVWTVGWNGTVVRTLNAGLNWETIAVTGKDYSDVWFDSNGLYGYFTGQQFGQTSDGGFNITHSSYGLENLLSRITFIDFNHGWGCGNSGRILSFAENTTGITEPEHSIPQAPGNTIFSSPNPFSVSSTVSFALPAECHVTLDLYDLTGRKIQTLHAGNLPGGEHNFILSGTDLPPGTYFLRLNAGGITETRPLIRIP